MCVLSEHATPSAHQRRGGERGPDGHLPVHGERAAAEPPAALPSGERPAQVSGKEQAPPPLISPPLRSGLQGMGGRQAIAKETRPVNSRRYVASFDVKNTTKRDSGRYRCIVQSERGVGVSYYAELTVKRESWPLIGCQLFSSV